MNCQSSFHKRIVILWRCFFFYLCIPLHSVFALTRFIRARHVRQVPRGPCLPGVVFDLRHAYPARRMNLESRAGEIIGSPFCSFFHNCPFRAILLSEH